MINCPKCGTAVKEEKAFCQNCGSPMDAAKAQRETPMPDFSATIIEPPRRRAAPPPPPPPQSYAPPATTEFQPAARPTAPVSYTPPAGMAQPAPPAGRHKSARKIGVGFVILLLFLMFLAFALAIVID